jgi:DNA-binding NtrC family response regulator
MIANADLPQVLVIDDEMGPRESLRMLLKPSYQVHTADSVEIGLQLLNEKKPDAIVLDIRMPGVTGIEGLRRIRQIDPHLSVIMLTGFGALETAKEAVRLGANDYISKPFDAREMREVISRMMRAKCGKSSVAMLPARVRIEQARPPRARSRN